MWNNLFYLAYLCVQSHAWQTSPVLQRYILKEGFHRDLETTLTVPAALLPEVSTDGNVQCYLLFTETVPSGAYIDPDQINSLRPYGGSDVLLTSSVDVEKPEFESTEFQALVFTNFSKGDNTWIGGYKIPIHLRYHSVSERDYAKVTFNNPEVAIRCFNKQVGMTHHGYHGGTVKQKSERCGSRTVLLCDWIVIEYDTDKMNVSVEVPVGKVQHYYLVTAGTLLTTLSCCLFLVYIALHVGKTKTTKES